MPDKLFSKKLLKWYDAHARSLPWRGTKDPYKIWVSEAMLQQTTVKTVLGYYDRWLGIFPDINSLASAPIEKVLKAWQGLGYYNRARNFHRSAQIVMAEHRGVLPSDPETLRKLPGFGPYMTASVASIAFDARVPLVDANVRRIVMRLLNIHGPAVASLDNELLLFLNNVLPLKRCGDFNQALMELGSQACTTNEPGCDACPLKSYCKAFKEGCQEQIPTPKKVEISQITAVIGLIRRNGKYLIQQRPAGGLLAGLWEFPGGKVEKTDKSLQEALARELLEELECSCLVGEEFCRVRHYYTTNKVHLIAFQAALGAGQFKLKKHQRWVGVKELQEYAMPSGNARILEKLLQPL